MNHYEFINDAWRTDLLVCSPALFVLVGCPIAIAVAVAHTLTVRAELIGHCQPCMTDIYLHIDALMADYIRTHPYR